MRGLVMLRLPQTLMAALVAALLVCGGAAQANPQLDYLQANTDTSAGGAFRRAARHS